MEKTAPLSKCYVANGKINEIVTRYYHKNIVTIARKSVTETSIARFYLTRRECKIRNRVAKTLNRRRVSIATSRHIRRAHSAGAFREPRHGS